MTLNLHAIAIDLGGTFVKYSLVSEAGKILFDGKLPVGGSATREDTLETIQNSIQNVVDEAFEKGIELKGIGIGTPGIVYNGVVMGGADKSGSMGKS